MAVTFRHLITGLLLLAGVFGIGGRAQTSTSLPRQVSFQFTVFALGGIDGVFYLPKEGAEAQALKFYSAYRSPTYHYKGGEQVRFFAPAADGIPAPVVAVYTVPEGAPQNLLLLFFPKDTVTDTGLKYDVYVVDDGADRTPAGSFTTINVSGREYAAQYGANRITIPRGIGTAHEGKGRVKLLLASQVDDAWMPAGRHEFVMGERDRVTLIFYPPANRTAIYPIIRRLAETLPPADKKSGEYAQSGVPSEDL
ncbi:MAG TPA: hypothetical protein VL357_12170 [Rariglobus sp.]|jgi:hypothetical protein|nr:hypothetical protein [Rariglobus sp.]